MRTSSIRSVIDMIYLTSNTKIEVGISDQLIEFELKY